MKSSLHFKTQLLSSSFFNCILISVHGSKSITPCVIVSSAEIATWRLAGLCYKSSVILNQPDTKCNVIDLSNQRCLFPDNHTFANSEGSEDVWDHWRQEYKEPFAEVKSSRHTCIMAPSIFSTKPLPKSDRRSFAHSFLGKAVIIDRLFSSTVASLSSFMISWKAVSSSFALIDDFFPFVITHFPSALISNSFTCMTLSLKISVDVNKR